MTNIKTLRELSQEYTLLYIEDDKDLRNSTVEIFEGLFKYTAWAEDGVSGLDTYTQYFDKHGKYFDLIVTDIQMPNMNGIELIKEIALVNKKQNIVVVSAYDDKKYLLDLLNLGVSGFIQKPLNAHQITETLFKVCNELSHEKELGRFIALKDGFIWDTEHKSLLDNTNEVNLTDNERKLFELLSSTINKKFTSLEIFEYIYADSEKEFSIDIIKSMFKRLRKKIPHDLILNTPQVGYNLQF